jgi:rSAM/selenodomain-associated transferase 2
VLTFSIIIPVYNEARIIENCLASLQSLRHSAEIIVVDGGSTDHTKLLATPLADKVIDANKGRARQMNAGAGSAHGDILLFLHADTLLPATALNDIEQAFNVCHHWGRFDVSLSGRHPMLKVIGLLMNWRSRITGIATGDQAMFVTASLFNQVGHYPEIALMEDIALSKKLKQHSPPACLHTSVISSGRRWEQFGILKTILLMWSLRLRYFFGASPDHLAAIYNEGRLWKI